MNFFYTNVCRYGNKILFRGISTGNNNAGRHIAEKVEFSPSLFVLKNDSKKPADRFSMFGDELRQIKFPDMNDARDFIQKYSDVENFPIFGNPNFVYQYITENFPEKIEYDIGLVNTQTIDIETTSEHGFPEVSTCKEEILLISLYSHNDNRVITFGSRDYHDSQDGETYIRAKNEAELLQMFLDHFFRTKLHVLTGWNIDGFDIPYLITRIEKILGDGSSKKLSPWGVIKSREVNSEGKTKVIYDILGISVIDYMALYKKFTYVTRESYTLDHISKVELKKGKLEYSGSFRDFYTNNYSQFVRYNIIDTVRVAELEEKLRLIELVITIAYKAKCNYNDVFSPVKTWECIIHNHLWENGKVIHQKTEEPAFRSIEGAYVMEPVAGMHHWIASFDATSLYPSIMMQYNMSPETFMGDIPPIAGANVESLLSKDNDPNVLDYLVAKNFAMVANGHCFLRDHLGVVPEIVQNYFDDRQAYKAKMIQAKIEYEKTNDAKLKNDISKYHNFQMAIKILLNSLYGAWAEKHFLFYDSRIAEAITLTGQLIIRTVSTSLDRYMNGLLGADENFTIYSDTDSCYLKFENLVQKFFANKSTQEIITILDKICKEKIVPEINRACDDLFNRTNGYQRKISFKRESICQKGIWVKKKKYALLVWDDEGVRYKEAVLKVMGLEIVRSSTPELVRASLREALNLIMTKTENDVQAYIREFEKRFRSMSVEEISFPRGVNGMDVYGVLQSKGILYAKGTPIHVRGAIMYNNYLNALRLTDRYRKIGNKDKIRFVYLKEPNPLGENCIAYSDKLPEEFGLHKYVDYDTMFEKTFLAPLQSILTPIGWNAKPVATLKHLFT